MGRFTGLAAEIMTRAARLGQVRFVAVDGPAGSGKTTFAGRLARALRAGGVGVAEVHIDDLLEGWTDLESFWPRTYDQVLEPLGRAEPGRYQTYDWVQGRFQPEWTTLAVPAVLIVEGVGSARTAGDPYRSLGVYVHAARELRLARGIERDGETLRPEWLRWMEAEDWHFAREDTVGRADLLVDGAPTIPHDPEEEYVLLPS
jgi:uridine kinase